MIKLILLLFLTWACGSERGSSNGRKTFRQTASKEAKPTWVQVGKSGFTGGSVVSVSMAAHGGHPFFAFGDHSRLNRLSVMVHNGEDWEILGQRGVSIGAALHPDLALSKKGIPHVAYAENVNSNRAKVMRFLDGKWQVLSHEGKEDKAPFLSKGAASQISLCIAGEIPHVVFSDKGRDNRLMALRYVDGAWVGSAEPVSQGHVAQTALAEEGGTVFLAYTDEAYGKRIFMARWEGDVVEDMDGAITASSPKDLSLAAHEGTVYLAFIDTDAKDSVKVFAYSQETWRPIQKGLPKDSVKHISLEIQNGTPYLAFDDEANKNKATILRFNGKTWEAAGLAGMSYASVEYLSLAASEGSLFLGYGEFDGVYRNVNRATVQRLPINGHSTVSPTPSKPKPSSQRSMSRNSKKAKKSDLVRGDPSIQPQTVTMED